MAQMILVEPFDLTFGGVAPSFTVSRGVSAGNLVTPDPREVFEDTGAAGSYLIDIDLGVATDWDVIALINCNAAAAATWSIAGGTGYTATVYLASTAMRLPSEDGIIASGPALFWSPTVLNGRYIRLTVTPNGAPINLIGALVVGKSYKPAQPRELGTGRPMTDTGVSARLELGGLATISGKIRSGFKWVFADLDPADLKRLGGFFRRRRTTEPMLLIEDPAENLAEGIHYGKFVNLVSYERRDQTKSRWEIEVEDWV
jgi:hypothetical protein